MTRAGRLRTVVARKRDDERGMTLIITLIAVLVISIVFTALLSYQNTALVAQGALITKRTGDLAADAAIDAAIAQLQVSRTKGASGGSACSSTTPATLTTWKDPVVGNVTVSCNMASVSSGVGTAPRQVHLVAAQAGSTIATADVTFYDPPSAAQPSVASITNWNRAG